MMYSQIDRRSRSKRHRRPRQRKSVRSLRQFETLEGRLLLAVFTPSKDNTLFESRTGATSNGAGQHLYAGLTNQTNDPLRRAVLAFDLTNIPAGSTITAATLSMVVTRSPFESLTMHDFSLHRLTTDWGEGTSSVTGAGGLGTASAAGDATWIHTSFESNAWATPGGDFVPTASATSTVGNEGATATWTSPGMVADIQAWVNAPSDNFGWILRGEEGGARKTARRFFSKEGATPPTLDVTFTPPSDPPDVTLSIDNSSIAEAAGTATVTATLSAPNTQPVTVGLGFGGTATETIDYTASASQIVITPGLTSGEVTITAVQDSVDEPDESVVVDIASVANGQEVGTQQVITTIVDEDLPPSFLVSSLNPTDSGFQIEFNRQLDTSVLNLYDTQNAGMGAADVVVTGASNGSIAGSLLVGESSIEFIKSGGALAADTYTVMLRSASDGFKDNAGMLLDGNGDGFAGGDYSAGFTVSAAPQGARVVSLPDFVRGPGQDVNVPADATTGIPISISDGENVRAADIRINYDPALLEITGATASGGGTVVVNTTTPGLAILVYFSTAALPAGPSEFINLQARVPANNGSAIYRSQQVLDVHDVVVGDGSDIEFPVVVDDAYHFVTYFADVSGNGRINASDAAQVARFAALIEDGFAASLNVDPLFVGDISGNGRINAADASRVAQFAALIDVPEIPPIPAQVVVTATADQGLIGPTHPGAAGRAALGGSVIGSLGFTEYADTLVAAPAARADSQRVDPVGTVAGDELIRDLLDDDLVTVLSLDWFHQA